MREKINMYWEHDHPYYCFNFEHFRETYMRASVTYPFIEARNNSSERENTHLLYIWHSLINEQWFDAGNSILIALEKNDINKYNALCIAKLMLLYHKPWGGMIGMVLHISVLRALSLYCGSISYADVADLTWEKALDITNKIVLMKDSRKIQRVKDTIIQGWNQYIEYEGLTDQYRKRLIEIMEKLKE